MCGTQGLASVKLGASNYQRTRPVQYSLMAVTHSSSNLEVPRQYPHEPCWLLNGVLGRVKCNSIGSSTAQQFGGTMCAILVLWRWHHLLVRWW